MTTSATIITRDPRLCGCDNGKPLYKSHGCQGKIISQVNYVGISHPDRPNHFHLIVDPKHPFGPWFDDWMNEDAAEEKRP